jgi:hypothetical protein
MNTGEMPWDNLIDNNKYTRRGMKCRVVKLDLCDHDCRYFGLKQQDKLL